MFEEFKTMKAKESEIADLRVVGDIMTINRASVSPDKVHSKHHKLLIWCDACCAQIVDEQTRVRLTTPQDPKSETGRGGASEVVKGLCSMCGSTTCIMSEHVGNANPTTIVETSLYVLNPD